MKSSTFVLSVALTTACIGGGGSGGLDGGVEELSLIEQPCSRDFQAEPTVKTNWAGEVQRCSESWAAGGLKRSCVSAAECEAVGLICSNKNGRLASETQCLVPCQPQACPGEFGERWAEQRHCLVCEDAPPHCSEDSSCRPRVYETVDGYGEACDWSPSECQDTQDCCSHRSGALSTCYDHIFNGEHIYHPTCDYNCDNDADCNAIYGAENGYCCLSRLLSEYPILGEGNGTRVCITREFDDRCQRVPTAGSGGSGGGGGGLSECQRCRNTCRGQGSWCQCDSECG